MQLSVIIVNYNVKYFLEQCLCSVQKACIGIDAEIFVVDNNSTDGSREWLEPRFDKVKFKWNKINEGFGKASNSVLKEAKGERILFLNPDTIVPEDCFHKCLSFFQGHPNCGALGVKMIDGSGRFLRESKRAFPSASFSMFKLTGLAILFPTSKLFAGYYAGHLSATENHKVEVLAGAFMMLDKKAISLTGGFDEAFFMYGEDVDLSYRVKRAGMENWYFAGSTIIHFKGESTQKLSPEYARNFYGAMILFVKKHYQANKGKIFLLQTAIQIAKLLANLNRTLKNPPAPSPGHETFNTAIVARQEKFDEVLQLIRYANFRVAICGRIAVDKMDKDFAIGRSTDLPGLVHQYKLRQIVFCEGEQSFKQIIEQITTVPPRAMVLIHANKSAGMVGSNDRNGRGIFIAQPSVS